MSSYIYCGCDGEKILDLLIEHGADVDAKARAGKDMTPLMVAVYQGRTDIVIRLLKAGANVNFKGEDGKTALDIAVKKKDKTMAGLLRKRGAELRRKLKETEE